MKRIVMIWISAMLALSCLASFPSISLAGGDTWTKKADMPTARCNFSTSMVNGKIYAIGDGSTTEEYDPATDTWTRKADMPTARNGLSTSTVNGIIYAIGGWGGNVLSTVEAYDPATDEWTKKADMLTARSDHLATSVVNGKIYAIGGWVGVGFTSRVEEYDPAKDTWTKKTDMPTARGLFSASAVNGRIYAIGGWNGIGMGRLSTVEEYDPATDRWTKKTDMPAPRSDLATSVVNGKIYAIGGCIGPPQAPQPSSIVEEYDPVTDTWTRKADMPTARGFLSASAVNGKIYAIGGWMLPNVYLSTVEEYDTGFAGESIEATGKLATTWGKVKAGN